MALAFAAAAVALSGCEREKPEGQGSSAPYAAAAGPTAAPGAPAGAKRLRQPKLLTAAAGRLQGGSAMGYAADDESGLPGRDVFDGDRRRSTTRVASATWDPAWGQPQDTPQQREALKDALTSVPSAQGLRTAPVPPPVAAPVPPADVPSQPTAVSRLLGAGTALAAFDAFQRKLEGEAVEVLSRAAWGARAARSQGYRQNPNRVTVHHTDGHPRTRLSDSIEEMRGYQSFHMNGRGWADIGYHFVIDGAGRVLEGRHAEILGAHAGGNANMDNIGIAVMGDYNRDYLNDAQKNSLRRLITFLALRYHSDPRQRDFIQPHQHYKSTDCPGTHIVAFLAELRADVTKDTFSYLDEANQSRRSFQPLALAEP